MTKINELMSLADSYAHVYAFVGDDTMPRRREALEQALEAALKPGQPFGYVSEHNCTGPLEFQFHKDRRTVYPDNCRAIHTVYTAPPAQTTCREPLTDEQIEKLAEGIAVDDFAHDLVRRVEKHFGIGEKP